MDKNINNSFDLIIVDDDSDVRALLNEYFTLQGYSVITASHGVHYKKLYQDNHFRLVIMDIEMPGESGFELLKWTRSQNNPPPVLMLSARSNLNDKVLGLDIGAEDYIVKPFEPRELLARVTVILRRESKNIIRQVQFGDFTFCLSSQSLTLQDKTIKITTSEAELLTIFCQHPSKVLTREFITQQIKGYQHDPFDRTIDIRITRLRKKIEQDPSNPRFLKTVRAKGYQLITMGDHNV